MKLDDPSLFREAAFLVGDWVPVGHDVQGALMQGPRSFAFQKLAASYSALAELQTQLAAESTAQGAVPHRRQRISQPIPQGLKKVLV